jgi:hypothetical protein
MAIIVVCPACGGKLHAPSQLLGRMAKCPQCGQTIKVIATADSPTVATQRPPSSAQKSSRKDAEPSAKVEPAHRASTRKPKTFPGESESEGTDFKVVAQDSEADQTRDFDTRRPTSRIAYGLGIPALILGILALLVSGIPSMFSLPSLISLLSMPLSGLGLLLGIAGLVVAITQRSRGIGFPIAGSAVSLVALVIGVLWFSLSGMAGRPKGASDLVAVAGAGQDEEPKNPALPKAPPEKEVRWIDASKGRIRQGDIRVEIGAVTVRNVKVKDLLGEETISPTKNLTIQVFIDNMSTTRKIDFLGWSGAGANAFALTDLLGGGSGSKANASEALAAAGRNAASLTDDVENSYKRITLELGGQIPGQISTATSIYPGTRVEDLLVFEPPIDNVQFLRLKLPAGAFGGTGTLCLQVPKSMLRR